MKILVTGGAGYIGSHFVWLAVEQGHDCIVVDNLSTGFEWLVHPKAELIVCDLANSERVSKIMSEENFDAVVHFAASIVVPESVSDPLKYYANNICNTTGLIQLCQSYGINRFVFSSTAAVYSADCEQPITEDGLLGPASPYGSSKLMSEQVLKDVAFASDFRYAALRYFNVAGAHPDGHLGQSNPASTHLIKVCCEALTGKRDQLEIFGTDYDTPDGTCIRDYIHVQDLVAAHLLALDYIDSNNESLIGNCGYGKGFSVREVLDVAEKVSGTTINKIESPRRAGDIPKLVADSQRIQKLLNWKPEHESLENMITHALSWEQQLQKKSS